MRGRRTRVARGIYRDRGGYSIVWRSAGKPIEKRYPLDTPLETLKKTRAREIQGTPRLTKAGSFVRDAVRFLRGRRALASWKSDRSHLRAWIHRFATSSRYALTADAIRDALTEWQLAGYSPRELRHRWRILSQFFESLEDGAINPCRRVKPPSIARTRPRSVSAALIREVAVNLRIQESEGVGRLRDARTRARFLVLATTGQRPAQLRRARPQDVDLERRTWIVDPAKGDLGSLIYLNDDMFAAWQLFVAADAWGHFDQRSFVRTLQRNGWPKSIRPYNLRHTVGLALSEAGVDLGDIQAHMGHASPTTTRQAYVPAVPARLMIASHRLDGRMAVAAAAVPRSGATQPAPTTAKGRKNPPQSKPTAFRAAGHPAQPKAAKSA